MTFIPSNMTRVPNVLWSRLSLGNVNRTNVELFRAQQQLGTGLAVARPSDDPVKAAAIGVLNERLSRAEQTRRNLQHAESSLGIVDNALEEASNIAEEARSIAATQLGITSSPEERRSQAVIVGQLLKSLFNTSSRSGPAGYVFGGSVTSRPPVEELGFGYRYIGQGPGLVTDLEAAGHVPLTLAANNAVGAIATRVRGTVDLDPRLTPGTRLVDVAGARGLGVTLGSIEFSVDNGERRGIDLRGCDCISDVVDRLDRAIAQFEEETGASVLGPGRVGVSGGSIALDVLPGANSPRVQFFDPATGVTAQDLGLASLDSTLAFGPGASGGLGLDPRLTWTTRLDELDGLVGSLGVVQIASQGRQARVDLSQAQTLEDVKGLIESAGMGIRVVINDAGTGIDVFSEMAVSKDAALSIEEVSGNALSATRLGIRSLGEATLVSDFNDGRGVRINDAMLNPTTGLADPALDADFDIILGDSGGTRLTIDLRPQDLASVGAVISRINEQAAAQLAAAGLPASAFQAGLLDGRNGIALVQDASFTGRIGIESRNNSAAAEDLGLLLGDWDSGNSRLVGEDRAKVRVTNLFTHLIDLRDSLSEGDERGITLAGEQIEAALGSLAETRGLVGGYAQRVEAATDRQQDRDVLDETIRSWLQDADFAEAATRLTLLQTQLEATLRVTASSQQFTLLDFLG